MPWRVTKMSAPGWQHDFHMRSTAVELLKSRICDTCLAAIGDANDPWLLLDTPCGCEYDFEQIDPNESLD